MNAFDCREEHETISAPDVAGALDEFENAIADAEVAPRGEIAAAAGDIATATAEFEALSAHLADADRARLHDLVRRARALLAGLR